jgi:hypothetical protein
MRMTRNQIRAGGIALLILGIVVIAGWWAGFFGA